MHKTTPGQMFSVRDLLREFPQKDSRNLDPVTLGSPKPGTVFEIDTAPLQQSNGLSDHEGPSDEAPQERQGLELDQATFGRVFEPLEGGPSAQEVWAMIQGEGQ